VNRNSSVVSDRYLICILAVVSIFVFFFKVGQGSLESWDEAIYGTVSREVLKLGRWLAPTFEGKLFLEKPPLSIWATSFFYMILGINEFTTRLFSVLCGLGTILVTYLIGSKLFNRWVGFLSGMVLLTSAHFPRRARLGNMDGPITLLTSLALLFFWLGRKKKIYFILSGIVLGLAFLTKGVTAVFVLFIIVIYCWWAGELYILKDRYFWFGMLACAMISAPWNIYEMLVFPQVYTRDMFAQIVMRITQAYEAHGGGFGYYFHVIWSKYAPWGILLCCTWPFILFMMLRDRRREAQFVLVWILVIIGALTLVRTKLSWYLFPVYPALSIFFAYFIARIIRKRHVFLATCVFLLIIWIQAYTNSLFRVDFNANIKKISPFVKAAVPEGRVVILYKSIERPAHIFYTERIATTVSTKEALLNAATKADFYCLISEQDFEELEPALVNANIEVRAAAGNLLLISN